MLCIFKDVRILRIFLRVFPYYSHIIHTHTHTRARARARARAPKFILYIKLDFFKIINS